MINTRTSFRAGLAVAALLSGVGAAFAGQAGPDPTAIRELVEGKRKDANAVWWGFDPINATAALQAAIRSGAATVLVPNVGKPWIVDPIFLEGNQEIDLEPGVEIQARRGGFRGKSDELFRIEDKSNVVIKGRGAVLRMHKEDYRKAPYVKAEWRACLAVYGATNVTISGITCADSGGDGLYIAGGRKPFSENIVVEDVVFENNYRQGISVISVDGLLIENSVLRGTEGTAPSAGIDFEPNGPSDRLTRIRLKNCVIEKNQSFGIWAYTGNLGADSAPVRIDIEGGRVSANHKGALFVSSGKARGAISIRATRLEGTRTLEVSRAFTVSIAPNGAVERRAAAGSL